MEKLYPLVMLVLFVPFQMAFVYFVYKLAIKVTEKLAKIAFFTLAIAQIPLLLLNIINLYEYYS